MSDNNTNKKQNKSSSLLVIIIVAVAAFLFGKYVIAPSYNNTDSGNTGGGSGTSITTVPKYSSLSGSKSINYVCENPSGSIIVTYYDDDSVGSLIGHFAWYDLTDDQVDDMEDEINDFIDEIEDKNLNGIELKFERRDTSFSVLYTFTHLNRIDIDNSDSVEYAANFLGLPCDDGLMNIDDVEDALYDLDYTLKQEF